MREQVIRLYNFKELPEFVQKQLLDKYRYWHTSDSCWAQQIIGDWKYQLDKLGFIDATILSSKSSGQGSGACFDCNKIDLEKALDNPELNDNGKYDKLRKVLHLLSAEVYRNNLSNHYCHKNTRSADINYNHKKLWRLEELINELEKDLETLRIKCCDEIFQELEAEEDYLTSDEALTESLSQDHYEFTKNGILWG